MIALFFFLAPALPPLLPFGAVGFFVTFVDVLAKDDVDLTVDVAALGLAGACAGVVAGADVGGAVAFAGFLVDSTFYLVFNGMKRRNSKKVKNIPLFLL